MRHLLSFGLLALMALNSNATHIIGGEIYYDHLGGDQYRVFLKLYRDCGPGNVNNTQYDAAATIGVFGGDGSALFTQSRGRADFSDCRASRRWRMPPKP